MFAPLLLISVLLTFARQGANVSLQIALVGVLMILYLCAHFFYPYTACDSRKNQITASEPQVLILGFLGFVLFTVIGGLFTKLAIRVLSGNPLEAYI